MPFRHLTKYQLSARIRAHRAAHRDLAGKAGSVARREEIRRELSKLLAATARERASRLAVRERASACEAERS